MADLLAGNKDFALMGGGGGRSRGGRHTSMDFGFDAGGGGSDPLDRLKTEFDQRRHSAPSQAAEPEMDEEDLKFQLEMQRELGLAGLDTDLGMESPADVGQGLSRRSSPSPAPVPSGSQNSDDGSLDDILGDVLDDDFRKPAKKVVRAPSKATPSRRSLVADDVDSLIDEADPHGSAPASSRAESNAPSRRGSVGGGYDESFGLAGDETPMPRRGSIAGRPPRAVSQTSRGESPMKHDDQSQSPGHRGSRGNFDFDHEAQGRGRRSRPQSVASDYDSFAPSDHSGAGEAAAGSRMSHASSQHGLDAASQHGGFDGDFLADGSGVHGAAGGGRPGRRKLAGGPRPSTTPADDNLFLPGDGDDGALASRNATALGARSASPFGEASGGSMTPPRTRERGPVDSDVGDDVPLYQPKAQAPPPASGGLFETELAVKPKRRLGKAKASPAPTPPPVTPPPQEEDNYGRATPPTSQQATPQHGALPLPAEGSREASLSPTGGIGRPPPLSPSQPIPSEELSGHVLGRQQQQQRAASPPSPSHDEIPQGENDNSDLDDLLQDNTRPPQPAAAQPPLAELTTPVSQSAQGLSGGGGGGSEDELPDFLRGERRPRRGERLGQAISTGLDLGFSAEDLDTALNESASATVPDASHVLGEGSGSGSGANLMDVPLLTAKPKASRRLAKAKPKVAAAPLEMAADQVQPASKAGSVLSSGHSAGSRASASPSGGQQHVGSSAQSPAASAVPSAALSATASVAASGVGPADNSAHTATAGAVASGSNSLGAHSAPPSAVPSGAHSLAAHSATPSAVPSGAPSIAAHSASRSVAPSTGHGVGAPSGSLGSPVNSTAMSAHSSLHAGSAPLAQGSMRGSAGMAGSEHVSAADGAFAPPSIPSAAGSGGGHMRTDEVAAAHSVAASSSVAMSAGLHNGITSVEIDQQAYYAALAASGGQHHIAAVAAAAARQQALLQVGQDFTGIASVPPSVGGAQLVDLAQPRHPGAGYGLLPARGLPPGSPLTQTAQSDAGSLRPHSYDEPTAPPPDPAQARAASAAAAAAAAATAVAATGGSPLASEARKSTICGGGGSPASEPLLSLYGGVDGPADLGVRPFGGGGFAAFPPLAAAPSTDLLSKLAYSEAKVRQLELQLEDCDVRWAQRTADAKQQSDAEHERMELQCRRLEAELDRCKEIHSGDLRHLNETKQLQLNGFEVEKENARRDERQKAKAEVENVRQDHALEIEELRRKHARALGIVQQQADMEVESLRRAQSGEHQLAKLVEQVQGSVTEVERMSKRVETDKSLEWSMRERQLEVREKNVREMEDRLSAQTKEVEDQRRRVSELVRHMEDSQVDDRSALSLERERLEAEHKRLLALQQSVRDADRNNKEALKHAWAQLEDDRHSFQQDMLRGESEVNNRREEVELQERQVRQEHERLKSLHEQIEVARQNASRRIRETEAAIANERRCLMSDLEVFEEKRRIFAGEVLKVDGDRKKLEEDRGAFDREVRSVGQMAAEVQHRSEELKTLHEQAAEARAEIQRLRGQLVEERTAQGSELEKLKTMQTLIEQQRLQLLQTENQMRVRGIEDIDFLVTTEAAFPAEADAASGLRGPFGALGGEAFGPTSPMLPATPQAAAGLYPPLGAPSGIAPNGMTTSSHSNDAAFAKSASVAARSVKGGRGSRLVAGFGSTRMPATPGQAGAGSHMQLQTLLRRTREASGEMQIYIQEQFRFLRRQQQGGEDADDHNLVVDGLQRHHWGGGAAGQYDTGLRADNLRFDTGLGADNLLHGDAGLGSAAHGWPVPQSMFGGGEPVAAALTATTSTESNGHEEDVVGGHTLEAFRPLSSEFDLTSGSTM